MGLLSAIKQAYKSVVKSDTTAYPQGQASYNGKPTDFVRLSVYGVCANAPQGSHLLLIGSQGMESTKFGIENDFLNRLQDLKEGEAALYNTLTESVVILKENGDIECDAKGDIIGTATGDISMTAGGSANVEAATEINLTAPTINLNGDVNVSGDLTATGTVEGSELTDGTIPYSTHKHAINSGSSAPGPTGVPA